MISEKEIEKLSALSRIELDPHEVEHMKKDMGAILAYVDQLKKAPGTVSDSPVMSFSKNVLRGDDIRHEPNSFTEALVSAAPKHDGRFVSVKKIL